LFLFCDMAVVAPPPPSPQVHHDHPMEVSKIVPIATSWSMDTLVNVDVRPYERSLGDTELSYYLPSRQSGVNDMYDLPHLSPIYCCRSMSDPGICTLVFAHQHIWYNGNASKRCGQFYVFFILFWHLKLSCTTTTMFGLCEYFCDHFLFI
jgi:hypothetical protein